MTARSLLFIPNVSGAGTLLTQQETRTILEFGYEDFGLTTPPDWATTRYEESPVSSV